MRLTLVLCAALLLAGCVFTESVFTVNKDNSVDFSFIKMVSKKISDEIMPDQEESVLEDSLAYGKFGMAVKAFEDKDNRGVQADGHFSRITDLNLFPLLADSTKAPSAPLVKEEKSTDHSLFTISYKPDVMKAMNAGQEDSEQDEMNEVMDQVLENKVTWKVPFEVVNTNAKIRNDSLGVYTWEFKGVEGDSIYLQYKVPSPAAAAKKFGFLLWGIPLLVVLGLALYFLLRKKKEQPQKVYQAPQEPDLPRSEEAPPDNDSPEETETTPPEEKE